MNINIPIDIALIKAELLYTLLNQQFGEGQYEFPNNGEDILKTQKRPTEDKINILMKLRILEIKCPQDLYEAYYEAHIQVQNAILVYLNYIEGEEQIFYYEDLIYLASLEQEFLEHAIQDINLNSYDNRLDTNDLLKRVIKFKETGKINLPSFQFYIFNFNKQKIVSAWNKKENAEKAAKDFNKYNEDDRGILFNKAQLLSLSIDPDINDNWEMED